MEELAKQVLEWNVVLYMILNPNATEKEISEFIDKIIAGTQVKDTKA